MLLLLALEATELAVRPWDDRYLREDPEDVYLGLLACEAFVFIAAGGPDTRRCPACLRALKKAYVSAFEAESHRRGVSADACAPVYLSRFALGSICAIATHLANLHDLAALRWAYALDLRSLHISRFTFLSAGMVSDCRCVGPSLPVPDQLIDRPKAGHDVYRGRALSDIQVDVPTYVNRFAGLIGAVLFQDREQPFLPLTTGRFFETHLTKTSSISWFGAATNYRWSRIAGVLEGLERRAGLACRHPHLQVKATFNKIGDHAVHPAELGIYEDEYYRRDTNVRAFHEDLELVWVRGSLAASGKPALVPAEYAFFGHPPQLIYGNSSGSASGSSMEEALLYGLLEAIERDSFVMHWLARMSAPHIDVNTIPDLQCQTLIARLAHYGATVHLLDGRLDTAIPIVFAVVTVPPNQYGTFSIAAAASFDPTEAARRALTEVATHFYKFPVRAEAAGRAHLQGAHNDYAKILHLEDHPLLYGQPETSTLTGFMLASPVTRAFGATFSDWEAARPRTLSLLDDVHFLIERLKNSGHPHVLWFDLTAPEQLQLGIRTVKALVPGLLPIDFGHGRSRAVRLPRLYRLPNRIRHRERPFTRADVNAAPHPFP